MKRLLLAATLLMPVAALAADNAVIVTPGAGVTMRSRDTTGAGGPQSMITILGDTAGTPSGVFSTYGTTPGAVTVPSVNAFVTNTPAVSQSGTWNIGTVTTITGPVPVSESGTWTVQPGNTANTTPWLVAGNNTNNADTVATSATNQATMAWLYGFNGTTWDRLRVDGSKNLNVNCAVGCSASTSITSWAGSTLGAITTYGTAPGAVLVPSMNAFMTNANANGQATMANSSPVAIASNQSAFPINVAATTTGGSSVTAGNNIVANNTTAVVVKASAGTLYGVQLGGIGSVPAYLKVYNATSATCGTGTPVKRLIIPVASTAANGAGSNITFGPQGLAMTTGITYCVTVGIADADTTAPAASSYLVNMDWQ